MSWDSVIGRGLQWHYGFRSIVRILPGSATNTHNMKTRPQRVIIEFVTPAFASSVPVKIERSTTPNRKYRADEPDILLAAALGLPLTETPSIPRGVTDSPLHD